MRKGHKLECAEGSEHQRRGDGGSEHKQENEDGERKAASGERGPGTSPHPTSAWLVNAACVAIT